MAIRTTPEAVREVIDTDPSANVDGYINSASKLVDYVASKDSASVLSSELLEQIELYLAAHFYALFDLQYRSKSTGDASGQFITGLEGEGLKATPWGQQAVAMDVSGTLAVISKGKVKVGMSWLGKTTQEQVTYWDRNN